MTGRFDRPGLLATVTGEAVLDGTAPVIRNAVTHATARRRESAGPGPAAAATHWPVRQHGELTGAELALAELARLELSRAE